MSPAEFKTVAEEIRDPTPTDQEHIYRRLVNILKQHCDIAIVDIPGGGTVLENLTVAVLADDITHDDELARLFRAQIWANTGDRP